MSSAPSIPHSPTPGKDPPPSSREDKSTLTPTTQPTHAHLPPLEPSLQQQNPTTTTNPMPPPPVPRPPKPKPKITTQAASTSNILSHRSLTHLSTLSQPPHSLHPSLSLEEKPRPPFAPFFTLINDVSPPGVVGGGSGGRENTLHPHKIHYIFSDDEGSDLTSSLIQSINPQPPSLSPSASASASASRELRELGSISTSSSGGGKDRGRGGGGGAGGTKGVEERVVIVDINEDGTGVKSVVSLSSEWQVLGASISSAPTFDDTYSETNTSERERGLMLRIEGVGVESLVVGDEELSGIGRLDKGRGEAVEFVGEEEMQGLMEGFDRKMEVLRRVFGSRGSKEDLAEENVAAAVPGAGAGGEEKEERRSLDS